MQFRVRRHASITYRLDNTPVHASLKSRHDTPWTGRMDFADRLHNKRQPLQRASALLLGRSPASMLVRPLHDCTNCIPQQERYGLGRASFGPMVCRCLCVCVCRLVLMERRTGPVLRAGKVSSVHGWPQGTNKNRENLPWRILFSRPDCFLAGLITGTSLRRLICRMRPATRSILRFAHAS